MKKLLFLLFLPTLAFGQFNANFTAIGDSVATGYIRGFGDTGDLMIDAGGGATTGVKIKSYGNNPRLMLVAADSLILETTGSGSYITAGGEAQAGGHILYFDAAAFNFNSKLRTNAGMPVSGVTSRFWQTTSDGVEISNTSSQTNFSDSISIDANAIEAGGTLRINTYMTYGHTNATPTVTLRLKYNDEIIADATVTPAAVSGSASTINIEWLVSVISTTTTRTTWKMTYYDGSTYKTLQQLDDATLSGTDFTDAGKLKLSAQWTAASALNKIKMKQIVGEYSDSPNN
jgi:hypothetical protein